MLMEYSSSYKKICKNIEKYVYFMYIFFNVNDYQHITYDIIETVHNIKS